MSKKIITITFLVIVGYVVFFWIQNQSEFSEDSPQIAEVKPHQKDIPSELIDQIIGPFNKGVALMERYKPVDAVKEFEDVVRLAPDWITGRLNLGIALLNTQKNADLLRAEEELKWVIERTPDNPYAHYALGMLFRHIGLFDDAIAEFQTVLKIDPEDADAHYQVGSLMMKKNPIAARGHFEKTLANKSHHEKAALQLQRLLMRAGEKQRAQEMLKRYQLLKSHLSFKSPSGSGISYGMKYGEMGRYAEVVRAFGEPVSSLETHTVPTYIDIAQNAGMTQVAPGTPDWPGNASQKTVSAFGPGIAVADIEGKNALYLYITGIDSNKGGVLYHYDAGQFSPVQNTGIDGKNAIGAFFGDYDGDGDPDLYLTCLGPNRLDRNDGEAQFTDVTATSGTGGGAFLSVGAAWTDADHDGDLDLYVTNFSSLTAETNGAPNFLWRNNGNGSFTEVATKSGISGENAASMAVLFFDIDDDRDTDLYLINHGSANRLFLNDRAGQYTDATSWFPALADAGPGLGALLGDVDMNGREDMLLLRGPEPPRLFLQIAQGQFMEDSTFKSNTWKLEGASGGLFGDIDIDGDLDIILLSAKTNDKISHQILMNKGT
ncbi:MAG: FG-GAP-like repeat-containing protein, partial [Candidatus Parabeggiatoa sp.]|nr:FG-GAP-like repeat-containing protein [Candidatus Parabeggiatoa sp.]